MKAYPITLLLVLCCFLSAALLANERAEIRFGARPYVDEEMILHLDLEVANHSRFPVQEVRLYYREFSETNFRYFRMKPQGFGYVASLDLSALAGNMVEYFVDVEYADGSHQEYPDEAPENNLLRESLHQDIESGEGIEVISPEPGEQIYTEEFLLTVSFFQYSANVDKERTKLYLNTWDVSRYATVFDDFLTFAPRRVPPGRHTLRLELYDASGRLLVKRVWSFTAIPQKGPSEAPAEQAFEVKGNLFGEYRREELFDGLQKNNYSKTGLSIDAGTRDITFGTRLYLSNQESGSVQPINRYTGWLNFSFWNNRYLRLTGGDTYPQLNPLIMNNVFLRGFYGQLFLKFINLDFATGRTRRSVEGKPLVDATGTTVDTTSGTFQRKVWAARASFGAREKFQWGLSVAKGKDQVNSIRFGKNPEESAAAGTDLYIALDQNRIMLEGNFNVSSYNPNILDGKDLPLDTLNKFGVDIDPDIYDLATGIITVNQFLIPEPNIAFQGQLRLNYFSNNLSFAYRFIDDEFHSLGQPFLLRDNKGFDITDNIRLFQNQVYLNLRYQDYENNLNNDKPATTSNRTIGFNLSYFPMRNLPSITFGYSNYQRDNGFTTSNNPAIFPEDNRTNTINFSTSYAFVTSNLRNRLTLTILNYDRKDNTSLGFDNLSNTFSIVLQTRYNVPLKTTAEFTFQQTENTAQAAANQNKLNLNSFGGGIEYFLGKFFSPDDNLLIGANGRYGLVGSDTQTTFNNSTITTNTDYNRTYLGGRLVYTHSRLGRLSVDADWVNYTGDRDFQDFVFTTRYDVTF